MTDDYIVAAGGPVALVAHLDTVFDAPPKHIYHDKEQHVIWSLEGLGADDRCGVLGIIEIIEAGYRPTVILTTDEELGGNGAIRLASEIYKTPLPRLKALIELDRQGKNDCVFYYCDNNSFRKYIESFGFKTERGSFTDISFLMRPLSAAGVNLSIGYMLEHSELEHVRTDWYDKTIEKVKKILDKEPTMKYYSYIPASTQEHSFYSLFT